MTFIIKKHISHEGKVIIAMCDKDLLGKKIEQGELQLDLTSSFYKGEEMDEEASLEIIKQGHILNVVGEKSVEFTLKNKLISKGNILKMNNVPYAQALIIRED